MICGGQAYTRLWMLTMFLGFDMRKCWATWAGSRLNRILLLSSFTFSMSSLSSSAWMNNHTTHTHTHAHTHTHTRTHTQHAHNTHTGGDREVRPHRVVCRSKAKLMLYCSNTIQLQCSTKLTGRCNSCSLSLEGDNDLQTRQTLTVILKIEKTLMIYWDWTGLHANTQTHIIPKCFEWHFFKIQAE